jgi:hypothetical protein
MVQREATRGLLRPFRPQALEAFSNPGHRPLAEALG